MYSLSNGSLMAASLLKIGCYLTMTSFGVSVGLFNFDIPEECHINTPCAVGGVEDTRRF